MARLTDEERPVKELSEGGERTAGALPKGRLQDEYVHAVTETTDKSNRSTGNRRSASGRWQLLGTICWGGSGSIAGQAIGNV